MDQITKANSLYVKTYMAIDWIMISDEFFSSKMHIVTFLHHNILNVTDQPYMNIAK